jgi:nitroimidazol reductase NimA-like FMN-containing flavoprotein (pyridoxamine 5'-phosphate oxidase superfamily)
MRRKDREVTEDEIIKDIISRADVCRIAFAVENEPYIVTMNFGYVPEGRGVLYFHCANEGRKLDMIRKNSRVCFQMDTDHKLYGGEKGCDWGMKYSSIVGFGNISFITDPVMRKTGLDYIMKHYGGDKSLDYDEKVMGRTTILRLDITEMTGKKR